MLMLRYKFHPACFALLITIVFLTAGCAQPFPRETLDKVNRNISFAELRKDPEKYKGAWVMLAGVIVASKNTNEGAYLEVLQRPLDRDGRPLETDETEGRFIVHSDKFLDTAVYHKGRLITVIAEIIGRKEQPLDEILYQYPFCALKDVRLWEPSTGPRFFFGVGIMQRL